MLPQQQNQFALNVGVFKPMAQHPGPTSLPLPVQSLQAWQPAATYPPGAATTGFALRSPLMADTWAREAEAAANPAAFGLETLRSTNLEGLLHQLSTTNPMVQGTARYGGFIDEFYAAMGPIINGGIAASKGVQKHVGVLAEKIKSLPFYGLFNRENVATAAYEAQPYMKVINSVAFGLTGVYGILDGVFHGFRGYKAVKEETGNQNYALARGTQMALGQAGFQYIGSYVIPPLIIEKVVHPHVDMMMHWGGDALNGVFRSARGLARKMSLDLPKIVIPMGEKTPFAALTALTSVAAGFASIQLMIKHLDPIFEHMLHGVWYEPTNKLLAKMFPDMNPKAGTTEQQQHMSTHLGFHQHGEAAVPKTA
ncbi:MAG: hypothetical protein SFZ03_05060 [Candidatus Melainabacteria bacterium]|nr:hypothetical protein [Candidatus Melainabacteria bacterium]